MKSESHRVWLEGKIKSYSNFILCPNSMLIWLNFIIYCVYILMYYKKLKCYKRKGWRYRIYVRIWLLLETECCYYASSEPITSSHECLIGAKVISFIGWIWSCASILKNSLLFFRACHHLSCPSPVVLSHFWRLSPLSSQLLCSSQPHCDSIGPTGQIPRPCFSTAAWQISVPC